MHLDESLEEVAELLVPLFYFEDGALIDELVLIKDRIRHDGHVVLLFLLLVLVVVLFIVLVVHLEEALRFGHADAPEDLALVLRDHVVGESGEVLADGALVYLQARHSILLLLGDRLGLEGVELLRELAKQQEDNPFRH